MKKSEHDHHVQQIQSDIQQLEGQAENINNLIDERKKQLNYLNGITTFEPEEDTEHGKSEQ